MKIRLDACSLKYLLICEYNALFLLQFYPFVCVCERMSERVCVCVFGMSVAVMLRIKAKTGSEKVEERKNLPRAKAQTQTHMHKMNRNV